MVNRDGKQMVTIQDKKLLLSELVLQMHGVQPTSVWRTDRVNACVLPDLPVTGGQVETALRDKYEPYRLLLSMFFKKHLYLHS